jgi:AcrR family transcriptional regulator
LTSGQTRTGRPRDASVSTAVSGAVLGLLSEEGFPALSMDAIAAKAGVSKASIYRRWSSKENLLVDVIANLAAATPLPTTGHLRDDLVDLLQRMEMFLTKIEAGQIFPRMAAEVHAGTDLGRRYAEKVILPRRAHLTGLLTEAQARGDLRPDLDLDVAIDMLTGPVILRLLMARLAGRDPGWAEKLVDALLQGWAPGP